MKTIRLLIVLLLLASSASARHHLSRKDRYAPTVYLVSVHEVDTIYNSGALRQAALDNRAAVAEAKQDYLETHRTGFQQDDYPKFVFTSKNNRFSFAVGGFVALRTGYDFDGISDNIDFIPYEIPIPGNYNTEQKLMMDASTSRLYISAIANTRALGRVVVHIDTDFRGGAPGSYTPRLRSAYVNFLGLTFGRDITTFCDLQAAPTTIDFQGPNAYNYDFATLIRYEVSFARRHMTFGIAAEMPRVSGTYGDNFAPMHQRVPDVPAYLQVAWGKDMSSHLRLSGIVRNMYLYNNRTQSTTSLLGWGAQFSGTIRVGRPLQLLRRALPDGGQPRVAADGHGPGPHQFEAVFVGRIVRTGDHDAAVKRTGKGGIIDFLGAAHADVRHFAAGLAQAEAQGVAQLRPGKAGVATDDHMARARFGHKGAPHGADKLGREGLRHGAAQVIGLEAVKIVHYASLSSSLAEAAGGASARP